MVVEVKLYVKPDPGEPMPYCGCPHANCSEPFKPGETIVSVHLRTEDLNALPLRTEFYRKDHWEQYCQHLKKFVVSDILEAEVTDG